MFVTNVFVLLSRDPPNGLWGLTVEGSLHDVEGAHLGVVVITLKNTIGTMLVKHCL